MINTMNELIEKLKKDFPQDGMYAVVRSLLNDINKFSFIETNCSYYKLIGFIYGLSVTGYLSDKESNLLINELMELTRK